MPTKVPVTVAYGGGIGPEIIAASLHVKTENLRTFDGTLAQGQ